jgi:hypothetical protein
MWQRRRFLYAHGRTMVAAEEEADVEAATEETGSSGVDGSGGDRWSREWQDLESFGIKSETTRGGLLFIVLKISAAVL